MKDNLTDHERRMILHSLGFDNPNVKTAYRNYYHAAPLSDNETIWLRLVSRGLAAEVSRGTSSTRFEVTQEGVYALGENYAEHVPLSEVPISGEARALRAALENLANNEYQRLEKTIEEAQRMMAREKKR